MNNFVWNRQSRSGFTRLIAAVLMLVVCAGQGNSQQRRVYIANDDHTDLMWAGDEEAYKKAWLDMLDYYLDQADRTDSLASDFQGRFNADGHYWLWTYEKNKTPAQFQRLIDRIRDGHITIPLQALVLTYGGMSAEAVLRSMYYAGRIERRYGLRFELVSAMENQTLPFGLPSLWAGAGAKYSWKGVCTCWSQVPGLDNRGREVYYAVGPDGRRVLMKWHSFIFNPSYSGGYAENRELGPANTVDAVPSDSRFFSKYAFPDVIGFFGYGSDDLQTTTEAFVDAAKSKSSVSRRVIVSNEVDFFKDFEASVAANSIPSLSAGFGNDWDGNVATMAEVTASVKRSVEALRPAEALATYACLVNPSFMSSREASRDSAFNNIGLFFEHNWNNDGVYTPQRPAFNRAKAAQIARYVSVLQSDASRIFAAAVRNPGGANRFFVFNPLGWTRTDGADIPFSPSGQFRVIDVATGLEVRSQLITLNGTSNLRILAADVPPVGYRVYEIQAAAPAVTDTAVTISNAGKTLENSKYKVTIDAAGALTSVVDKSDGDREWASAKMNDLGASAGSVTTENAGPVSSTLLINANGSPRHRTRLTLYKDIDRIDIENEITENFQGDSPLGYGFGFNIAGATVRHEEVGAIATAKLSSDGGSYATSSARFDYLTLNHFADISAPDRGMTLSNWDSQFFRLGNSSMGTLDGNSSRIQAIVGGRLAPATRAFAGQDGDSYFKNRYALQTHGAYSQAAAMRMALEHQNPFVTGAVGTNSNGRFPESTFSLISVSDSSVVLWALKPAEEGISEGMIARLWNVDQASHNVQLTLKSGTLLQAARTTHLETDLTSINSADNAITDTLPGQWMQTYRLKFENTTNSVAGEGAFSRTAGFRVRQNYPNPFNPETTISFDLDARARVRLVIFDILGRQVSVLADGTLDKGTHNYTVRADRLGMGSGIYFYRLEAGSYKETNKMVLIK